jgi:hypothetical protein
MGKNELATHLALECQDACLSTSKAAADEERRYGSVCAVHPLSDTGTKLMDF